MTRRYNTVTSLLAAGELGCWSAFDRTIMILYKYMNTDRIDVISKKYIRFTQPGLFNDPFESIPVLKSFGSDSDVKEAMLKTIEDEGVCV